MKKGDILWGAFFIGISALLVIPSTHEIFVSTTNLHPYLMGFMKFAIMATMGELLAIRIVSGDWKRPEGVQFKAIVWGIVGLLTVMMFGIYSNGVAGAIKVGLLFNTQGLPGTILNALYVSIIMNFTFGAMFMAAHRVSDTYIDLRSAGNKVNLSQTIEKIEWSTFIKFVIGKTIPFFWIPAHTITFLLPPQYRVLWAAYLSVALGVILSYAKRKA
jgi:hypothetical protein